MKFLKKNGKEKKQTQKSCFFFSKSKVNKIAKIFKALADAVISHEGFRSVIRQKIMSKIPLLDDILF